MAMRLIVSRTTFGNCQTSTISVSGLRRFSDRGKVLSEEERAKETVYVQKMERERLEKLKLKAEKENADKSDKKGDGGSQKS